MKNNKQPLLLIGVLLLFAFTAKASDCKSEPCMIQGQVMDAVTKKPVSGVVVSATAPGTPNQKEVITDADGFFSFNQLPSSQVNLQFGKKGYQSYKRSCVLVKEKPSLKITVEFLPEDMEEDTDNSDYPLLRLFDVR